MQWQTFTCGDGRIVMRYETITCVACVDCGWESFDFSVGSCKYCGSIMQEKTVQTDVEYWIDHPPWRIVDGVVTPVAYSKLDVNPDERKPT